MSTSTVVSERERAKRIIADIIREAGGVVTSKAELVRLYWRAHLAYAESQPGYLSIWPLRKTADGPTIQEADLLLGELVAEGMLRIDDLHSGVSGLRLHLTNQSATDETLLTDAVEAIQQAVEHSDEFPDLADYTALRCWNAAAEGEELNIYLDVIPPAEYADRKQRLDEMATVLKEVCR